MPTFTVLQRGDLIRAEQDDSAIESFTVCGYTARGQIEAQTPEQAVSEYVTQYGMGEKPKKPLGLRWIMGVAGVFAIVWFVFVIFFLLPTAFEG
ncbi:hypothetical protein [Marinomonas ostreistagni]|uniref:DUF4178 domain-containing protein n=1 Tax=Marinomonas ostreistagni TaxID=359209 RepID=A0ABS0ZBQ1_9GAMM|nr:hypothetical protein [Marinomonas ostreistagni]MBJ7551047.1 hypothetical protein [Marinomonas ostreistagni]